MQYQIKKLELGGILDQSFTIIRQHAGLLFGIVAVSIIPLQLIVGLGGHFLKENGVDPSVSIAIVAGSSLLLMPVALLANIAVVHAVASVYLSRSTTISECFGHAARRFLPAVGTFILMMLAVFGGFLLFIIPGIVFSFWFLLSQQVTILESIAGSQALKRSRALMRGNVGTAFVLLFVVGIFNVCVSLAAAVIPTDVGKLIAGAIVQGFTVLVSSAAQVVFYFSCRCKLENFDLQMLASSIADEGDHQPDEDARFASAES